MEEPKTYHLPTPLRKEDVARLRTGDLVYLTGRVHTMRDAGYERTLQRLDAGQPLPFTLTDGVIWHCGPITRKQGKRWRIVSAGSTTSSRFTAPAATLIERLGVRAVMGKGVMGKETVEAMRRYTAAYLVTTGGAGAYYAQKIKEIEKVYWLDLGMPAAVWVFHVEEFGPLLVGIDAQGQSLHDALTAQVRENIRKVYADLRIDQSRRYTWWPRRVMGTPWHRDPPPRIETHI